MTQRILVPVDVEEPESWTAVLPELRLHAKGHPVHLTVATVVPELGTVIAQAAQASPFASAPPAEFRERALAVAGDRLRELTDGDEFGPIERIVLAGNIYAEILQTAKDIEADLIVLMSHMPGIDDYLLGSNAARIVRHATCSVLVVRPK